MVFPMNSIPLLTRRCNYSHQICRDHDVVKALVKNLSGKFLHISTKLQKGRTRVWSSSGGNSKFENKRRFHYHKFKRRKPRNETKEAQEGTSSRDLNPNPNFNETWGWTRVNLVCLFACPLGFWGRTEGVWSRRRETGNHGKRRAAQEREREGWGSQCLMKCSTGWMCALHFGCVEKTGQWRCN